MPGSPPGYRVSALLVHSALIQAVTFLLRPATTYQALAIDVPPAALGVIGASFAVVPLLLAVPVGRLVQPVGERTVLVVGSAAVVVACAIFLLASASAIGLLVASAALGAAHLLCVVSQQSLVAAGSLGGRLDAMFGYYTFAASLGQGVGPLLIAALGGSSVRPDTAPVFWCAAGLSLALLVTGLVTVPGRRTPRAERRPPRGHGGSVRQLLAVPGLLPALATSAVITAAVDLTVVYLPALGAERGFSAAWVGALLVVRAVCSMASRLLLGRLSRALGRSRLMAVSIAAAAAGLLAAALPLPVGALAVVMAVMGLGLGVGQPLTMSWLAERTPAPQRGLALSVRLAGNRVGQVGLPSALGVVAAGLGASGVLAATGLTVAATWLLVRAVRLDGDVPPRDH